MLVKNNNVPASVASPLRRSQEHSSVRLRKRRDGCQEEFKKSRTSGEFGYLSPAQQERQRNKREPGEHSFASFPVEGNVDHGRGNILPRMSSREEEEENQSAMETLDRRLTMALNVTGIKARHQAGSQPGAMTATSPMSETESRSMWKESLCGSPVKPDKRVSRGHMRHSRSDGESFGNWRKTGERDCRSQVDGGTDYRRLEWRNQVNGGTRYKEFGPIDFPPEYEVRSTKSSYGTKADRGRAAGLGRRSATHGEIRRQKSENGENQRNYSQSQDNIHQDLPHHDSTPPTSNKSPISSQIQTSETQGEPSTLKKGILWHQRDKLFSRWKERFFLLTRDYLQCFKKGTSRMTEMGAFMFKIKLSDVEMIDLVDKRGYLTISLLVNREGKMLLRKPEGIREWFDMIKGCVRECQQRNMKSTEEFWSKRQFTDSSTVEQWLIARNKIGLQYSYCDSGPGMTKSTSEHTSLSAKTVSKASPKSRSDLSPVPVRPGSAGAGTTRPGSTVGSRQQTRTQNKSKQRSTNYSHRTSYVDTKQFTIWDEANGLDKEREPGDGEVTTKKEDQLSHDSGNDSLNTNTSTGGSRGSSQLGGGTTREGGRYNTGQGDSTGAEGARRRNGGGTSFLPNRTGRTGNFIKGDNGNIYVAPSLGPNMKGPMSETSAMSEIKRMAHLNGQRKSQLPSMATRV